MVSGKSLGGAGADEYKWVINGQYEDLLDFGADLLYGDGYDDYLNGACAPITDYFSYANVWTTGSGDIMTEGGAYLLPSGRLRCPLPADRRGLGLCWLQPRRPEPRGHW